MGREVTAFIILIVPVTFFCVFSEQIINGRNQWFVLLIRMTPIIGLIFCIVLYPSKFGLMFTIIPIYCLYFSVFGYAGKHFRKCAGPLPVGISHGIFLSYAFAATTPMFAPQPQTKLVNKPFHFSVDKFAAAAFASLAQYTTNRTRLQTKRIGF